MRVGVIGSGGMARVHATSWCALGVEVQIHSRSGAAQLASQLDAVAEESHDALMAWADVVDICTPTPTHIGFALSAIAAGKHVVCEKPLARTAADAREIAAAAKRAGVRVFPAHVVRYFPEYAELHASVTAGRIGELVTLHFSRGGSGPANDWFYASAESGGLAMDQLIHDIDQARWLAGPVIEISATQHPPSDEHGILPREVIAEVVLTHASGARSLIQGAWGPAGTEFSTSFEVVGTAGALRSAPLKGIGGNGRPYLDELHEFAVAVAGGAEPRVSPEDGVIAVALAEAAAESILSGCTTTFDESEALGPSAGPDRGPRNWI